MISFFQYAKVDDHLPLMQQLQRAATLPPVEQNGMVGAIVYSMQNRTEFDSCWLESIQEKILCKVIHSGPENLKKSSPKNSVK